MDPQYATLTLPALIGVLGTALAQRFFPRLAAWILSGVTLPVPRQPANPAAPVGPAPAQPPLLVVPPSVLSPELRAAIGAIVQQAVDNAVNQAVKSILAALQPPTAPAK